MVERFLGSSNYKLLYNAIEDGENVSVFGLNIGEKLALIEDSAFVFYIAQNLENASIVQDKLISLGKRVALLSSNIDPFTSEFVKCDNTIEILAKLRNEELDVVILTPEIIAGKFPKIDRIQSMNITISDSLDIQDLIRKLVSFNYKRVDLVANHGEFSVRGDIIDIYPLGGEHTRIFFDFDRVENIKLYNPITMLTTASVNELNILSNTYYKFHREKLDDLYKSKKCPYDEQYDCLIDESKNNYLRLLFDDLDSSIFDYVDNAQIVFDGAKNIYDELIQYIDNHNNALKSLKKPFNDIYKEKSLKVNDVLKFNNHTLIAFHFIQQANRFFSPTRVFSIRTLPSTNYTNFKDVLLLDITNYIKQNYTIILCAGNNEEANKLKSIFDKNNISNFIFPRLTNANKNAVNIISKNYPLDIILPEDKLVIVSTENLSGKRKRIIEKENSFFDGEMPSLGDYVVHNIHGVGKCLGIETLKISNAFRDYVIVEYKNNDKLYLPVENIDQISKFIGSETSPQLNKIGGVEFAKTKAKVKTAVKKIAFDLIALYRDRLNLVGYKYSPDDEIQEQFEKGFGFNETADQLKAVSDCKEDMESGKVMDRLVCGDVGYGKTEVALRIAFKTILAGKQVALLCPTTILSEQHYNTAKSRMANFGVKIEVLNRLKNNKEVTKIKKDISDGKIDLICGTHKLLASDIDYKNLGLLILDEEQKFGVADKEKLKNIKKKINVLTLSATPIPRTLNMSLIGVRDISVIETPPVQRLESVVQVVEYSDFLIKSAIEKELKRNGQVLIIYNRVETIYKFAQMIKSIVGNAVVSVAHGQMTDVELETEIYNLYSGKTQILVSTTLIENGVDLPNANTLIVINSDMLGLSQLYQLKGRIGRADKQAYAYFTFDSRKNLTENAYKRLNAIGEFSGMGSGFKIAMRDLEIRGAGSLLGLEQSGHIEKIGYNMYVQLLGDSVKELKGEKVKTKTDTRVETSISAYLSQNYVSSTSRRMEIYRQIAGISNTDKLLKFIKDTAEIYGDVPSDLVNLAKIGYIKNLCGEIGVYKISINTLTSLYFEDKECLTEDLITATEQYKESVILNLSSSPVVEIKGVQMDKILDFLINYLQLITNK